jgi:DNA-binding protein YbaB
MVQELIVAATNAALDNARAAVRDELRKLTGGMDIPGLDMLIGR